jgi:hypothetical protein
MSATALFAGSPLAAVSTPGSVRVPVFEIDITWTEDFERASITGHR